MLLLLCLFLASSLATKGIDVSAPVSLTAARCLRNEGWSFAVARAYRSYGAPDKNAAATVKNFWDADFRHVDLYMFPCPRCGKSAAEQVQELAQYISSNGVKFGMVWLDIEGASQYWHSSKSENQQFFQALFSEAKKHWHVGVYANENTWGSIMGLDYTGGSSASLWYAHYDSNPSFSDFRPFGGWSRPSIKQYNDNGNTCGVGYDVNWYP